jgi:hypothetical protein
MVLIDWCNCREIAEFQDFQVQNSNYVKEVKVTTSAYLGSLLFCGPVSLTITTNQRPPVVTRPL